MKDTLLLSMLCMFSLIMSGCQKDELSGNEYMKFVETERNGLKRNKQIGDMLFQLQYCPTEYLLIKEFKSDFLPETVVEQRKNENEGFLFFKLRISADGSNDVLNYDVKSGDDAYARIQYLSYGFEEDIALVNEMDTIFPALFHFERTYGVVPYADFMMSFNTTLKENEDFQILIDDKAFNNGMIKFTYKNADIQSAPQLISQ